MAEGIRLELSLADKFTAELKKHRDSLAGFRTAVKDTQFKFQFAWAQMEDSLRRFSTGTVGQKVKQLASVMEGAVRKMQAAWHRLAVETMNGGARMGNALNSLKQRLTSLPALIAGSVAAASFGAAIKQGLQFNSTIEGLTTQFEVMTGSATRASNIIKELVQFSASTPFELEGVAAAARTMMAFGLSGRDTLRRIGDAAAAAQRPMEEVAMVFGRINSGSFGEAFQRLAEMGIATRRMLEAEGLRFDKSGSYIGTVDQAMAALNKIVDSRFGGMMDKMSQTLSGRISTLKDDWAMTLGVITRTMFNNAKPQLDRLSAAIKKLVSSGAAADIGRRLAGPLNSIVGGLIAMIERAPNIFGALVGGIDWAWATAKAFAVWVPVAFQRMAMDVQAAFAAVPATIGKLFTQGLKFVMEIVVATLGQLFPKLVDMAEPMFEAMDAKINQFADAIEGRIPAAARAARAGLEGLYQFLTDDLAQALRSPGLIAGWKSGDLSSRGGTGGFGAATGPGLDEPASFARAPSMKAPGSEFLDRNAARLKAEKDLESALFEMRLESFDIQKLALDQLDQQWMETKKEMWADYYEGLSTMGTELFVDSMSTLILEDAENMKLALDDIWQGVKESFVRMSLGMVAQWIKGRIRMAIAEQTIMKGTAAAQLAGSAPKIAAMTGETAAAAGLASAGYHAALAWMGPFGAGLAASLTAQMNATIAATKIANLAAMRGGGVLAGSGSGNEDNRLVAMSSGEAVLNRRAVDTYGRETVDALNRLQLQPSGGTFAPTFVVPGGGGDVRGLIRDIEDYIVPELERLARLRRFKVVMTS